MIAQTHKRKGEKSVKNKLLSPITGGLIVFIVNNLNHHITMSKFNPYSIFDPNINAYTSPDPGIKNSSNWISNKSTLIYMKLNNVR